MIYQNFINIAQLQDSRNIFEPCDSDLSFVPLPLRSFYQETNPVKVEIILDDLTSVCFCPVKYLLRLQDEYDFKYPAFIFATQEGDPIYYKPNGVFRCSHSDFSHKETNISDSFDSFIEMLIKKMLEKNK